jgi:hypothetical protein
MFRATQQLREQSGLKRVPLRVMPVIRDTWKRIVSCFGGLYDLLAACNVATPAV